MKGVTLTSISAKVYLRCVFGWTSTASVSMTLRWTFVKVNNVPEAIEAWSMFRPVWAEQRRVSTWARPIRVTNRPRGIKAFVQPLPRLKLFTLCLFRYSNDLTPQFRRRSLFSRWTGVLSAYNLPGQPHSSHRRWELQEMWRHLNRLCPSTWHT